MRRPLPLVLVALAAAGCGGGTKTELVRPTLPHALAGEWRAQADAVAAALAAGDGCTARSKALALQTSVVQAIQANRVRPAFQETLMSTANELVDRIACNPPPPPPPHGHPKPPKPHGHDKGPKR